MKTKKDNLEGLLKRFFKTSAFIFIAVFLSKVFSYLYKVVIARHFGAEIYGLFSIAIILPGLFVSIFSFGLGEGALRYISFYRGKKDKQSMRYVFNVSFKIISISTIIAGILLFFLSEKIALGLFNDPNLIIFLKGFSFIIPFWALGLFFFGVMQSFEKVKQASLIEKIIQSSLKISLLTLFIKFGLKTNSIIYSFSLGIFGFFLLNYLYCKFNLKGIFKRNNLKSIKQKKLFKELFNYSLPIMFLGIIAGIFYWIDTFTIGFFKSATEVGIYNVAVPIALLLNFAPELFLQLLFPLITKEYAKKNTLLIKELTKQIVKWIFIINLPFFLLMIIFPGAIINLLFGPEYLIAENALRFLLIGGLASSLFIVSHKLLSMAGKSKIILIDLIIASTINIILNIILVPKEMIFSLDNSLGINGAAIATLTSVVLFNLLLAFHAKKYTSIFPFRRKVFKILLISLIPLFLLIIIKNFIKINIISIIILCVSFVLTYILLLFLMNGLDKNDLMIVTAIRNKFFKKNL